VRVEGMSLCRLDCEASRAARGSGDVVEYLIKGMEQS